MTIEVLSDEYLIMNESVSGHDHEILSIDLRNKSGAIIKSFFSNRSFAILIYI